MVEENNDAEQELKLEQVLKDISCLLWTEIKKDLPFFGGCGFVVTYLLLVEDFFRQWCPNCDSSSFAGELLLGFISLGDYGPLMIGLTIIGLITNILYCFKQQYACLNNMYVCFDNIVKHVEHKFTQLISVTTSFAAGVISFALLHAIFTGTFSRIPLAALSVSAFFIIFILVFSITPYIVARKIEPFGNKWYASALFLISILVAIFLVLTGCKILMYTFGLILALLVFLVLGYRKWKERQQ